MALENRLTFMTDIIASIQKRPFTYIALGLVALSGYCVRYATNSFSGVITDVKYYEEDYPTGVYEDHALVSVREDNGHITKLKVVGRSGRELSDATLEDLDQLKNLRERVAVSKGFITTYDTEGNIEVNPSNIQPRGRWLEE